MATEAHDKELASYRVAFVAGCTQRENMDKMQMTLVRVHYGTM